MSKHNYTNPAFCQNSEFYPLPASMAKKQSNAVEAIYNRSLNLNLNSSASRSARDGPLRIQRSMSTRSFVAQQNATTRRNETRLEYTSQRQPSMDLNLTMDGIAPHTGGMGRYALVPVEELQHGNALSGRYSIVPGPLSLRQSQSHEHLDLECVTEQYTSLPPVFSEHNGNNNSPKIKHAFSSDFGSKSFLIVDKNSNQRYQMVPTAENEELVDDNHEIIQMHNGRAHRYAVIPTEEDEDLEEQLVEAEEEETCLSNSDLYNNSHMHTSTPQPSGSYQNTPLKNPIATKMLHELLSTPRKPPQIRSVQSTPRKLPPKTLHSARSQQQIYYPQRQRQLHYETIRAVAPSTTNDRTMAVITPRVAESKSYVAEEEDCSSIEGRSQLQNNSYPQKVVNATITLAIVSLMLVLGSTMNSGLIIYMIAHVSFLF